MSELEFEIIPKDQRHAPSGAEKLVVRGAPGKSAALWFGSEDVGWCGLSKLQMRDLRDALDAVLG